jgi:hypothetical protein
VRRKMRRTILLLIAVAVAILLVGGVALAKNINCPNRDRNLCVGTNRADTVKARGGNDAVTARGGNDKVFG